MAKNTDRRCVIAGKRQKPFNLLQDQRASRRREVYIPAQQWTNWPADEAEEDDPGDPAGIAVATDLISRALGGGRAFGQVRGADRELDELLQAAARGGPRGGKRRYTPRSQRQPNELRKRLAATRPRDSRGHFLPRGAANSEDAIAGTPDEAA